MTETALRRYASLRKAIEGAEGELIITTEGLLMYLTQAELELVPMGRYMPETIVAYKQLPEDLRTQLRKALDSDQNISLVNMNDSVREIIETTGFDTILC